MRNTQVAAALREMLGNWGSSGGSVNYAVAAQSVFARFVKLPAVDEEKIERIIAFEAQQNVPFPIDEVVWDYQLVGGGADEQIQVVLVAIKADLLDEINAAVEERGSANRRSSMWRRWRSTTRFATTTATSSGCSLLVDIGARTTNLLFIEPGKIFTRSVPIGGSSITSAIAKEFDEPFGAAEFRKKRDGFVSLGGAYAEAGRSRCGARVENRAQHDDAAARGVDALDQPLSRAATGERAGARFSLRRQREHAVHARILPGKTATADRIL